MASAVNYLMTLPLQSLGFCFLQIKNAGEKCSFRETLPRPPTVVQACAVSFPALPPGKKLISRGTWERRERPFQGSWRSRRGFRCPGNEWDQRLRPLVGRQGAVSPDRGAGMSWSLHAAASLCLSESSRPPRAVTQLCAPRMGDRCPAAREGPQRSRRRLQLP